MKNYRELVILQNIMSLSDKIKAVTAKFPDHERFGIVADIEEALTTVSANVVTGYEQKTRVKAGQYMAIAQVAAESLETQLILCQKQDYLDNEKANALLGKAGEIVKMLQAIRRQLLQP